MNIYIACALTHVPRDKFNEYSEWIHSIANSISIPHDVKYALINSDPQLAKKPDENKSRLCYLWDRKMVEEADLVIAECSFPSTGLGIELQVAENKNIPILLCFRDYGTNKSNPISYENPDHTQHQLQIGEGYISHMVLGMPNVIGTLFCGDTINDLDKIKSMVNLVESD
jgi:hypothetical protein